jgi:hypothetical protein
LQGPPKFTQIGIFGLKIYHLATLDKSCESRRKISVKNGFGRERLRNGSQVPFSPIPYFNDDHRYLRFSRLTQLYEFRSSCGLVLHRIAVGFICICAQRSSPYWHFLYPLTVGYMGLFNESLIHAISLEAPQSLAAPLSLVAPLSLAALRPISVCSISGTQQNSNFKE